MDASRPVCNVESSIVFYVREFHENSNLSDRLWIREDVFGIIRGLDLLQTRVIRTPVLLWP
jgi:hypothetical protein